MEEALGGKPVLSAWIEAELGPRDPLRLLFESGDIGEPEIATGLLWRKGHWAYEHGFIDTTGGGCGERR